MQSRYFSRIENFNAMPPPKPYDRGPNAGHEMMEIRETTGDDASSSMLPHDSAHYLGKEKRMGGRFSDIALSSLILTIPMLLFVCVLLGLVFHYRVQPKGVPFENLKLSGSQDEKGVYYVNISSTVLVFIASWSSSLAPALGSFALALVAYPVARTYLKEERAGNPRKLLTPYQLFLTLQFLDGGWAFSLWKWFKYMFKRRTRRQPQASPLSTTAGIAILAAVLS
jgi:hypothetical protein